MSINIKYSNTVKFDSVREIPLKEKRGDISYSTTIGGHRLTASTTETCIGEKYCTTGSEGNNNYDIGRLSTNTTDLIVCYLSEFN